MEQKASSKPVETVENRVQNGTKVVKKSVFLLLLRVAPGHHVCESAARDERRRVQLCEPFKLV